MAKSSEAKLRTSTKLFWVSHPNSSGLRMFEFVQGVCLKLSGTLKEMSSDATDDILCTLFLYV